jgi:hypothetical protein
MKTKEKTTNGFFIMGVVFRHNILELRKSWFYERAELEITGTR